MRKSKIRLAAFFVIAAATLSCSKDTTVDNIKAGIIGTWKLSSVDGIDTQTNDKTISRYSSDGICALSYFNSPIWYVDEEYGYTVSGRNLEISPLVEDGEDSTHIVATVVSVDTRNLTLSGFSSSAGQHGDVLAFQKVTEDYSAKILGLWEGTQITGGQTHGDENHRWEYKSDGTYVYYSKDESGNWIPDPGNDGCTFVVKGDFFVSSWSKGGQSYQECWDITKCNSYQMEWSATRIDEAGNPFSTTLQMSRVLTEEEIAKKIIGKWKMMSINDEDVLTDARSVLTFKEDETLMQTNFSEGKWEHQVVGAYSISDREVRCLSTINTVVSINDREMIYSPVKASSRIMYNSQSWSRVTEDFEQTILGTWEGVAMTGDPTFGDIDHRWEFKSDGSYVYYSKDSEGRWVPDTSDTENAYAVDGNYLCFRWKSGGTAYREWWDIETCDDNTMIWSALRKDSYGEVSSTLFDLVRVL